MVTKALRPRRRRFRGRVPIRRVVLIAVLAALLIALGIYYVVQYQRHLVYAQYPLSYKDLIVRMSREYNLEPWHVAAVIRCESSFNAKATSGVGARGLMQIMPETGQWLAGKFDEDDGFDPDTLYTPEVNVKYGCWYLSWLMKRYNRSVPLTTMAYHAGHGTVDKWLADRDVSADGLTIDPDKVPYQSTAQYLKRVLKAYEKYEELYDYET